MLAGRTGQRAKAMKKKRRRRRANRRPPVLTLRTWLLANLHRPPCKWDVLISELAEHLLGAYDDHRSQFQSDTFSFDGQDRIAVAWMLARGLEVWVGQKRLLSKADADSTHFWYLNPETATGLARQITIECFDPLLRKYVEDTRDTYSGRPHRDLDPLLDRLQQALQSFLGARCVSGGDLYACLTDPLADDQGYFSRHIATGPMALPASSGDPAIDVYNLGHVVEDTDGPVQIKRKLVSFVRHDPWLFAEHMMFVQDRQQVGGPVGDLDPVMAADDATDLFIYQATHLAGRSPIELLTDRQLELSDQQRSRLVRWDREQFTGVFLVKAVTLPFLEVRDLELDRDMKLEATKPDTLRALQPGEVLASRVAPWDDHWLLSGVQWNLGRAPEATLATLRRELALQLPLRRLADDDPRVRKAFEIQEKQHATWVSLFGSDEMLFKDGLDLGAAMNRFHHHWAFEMILPDVGSTRAQGFQARHGQQAPDAKIQLPDDLLEAKDVGLIFHRRHGIVFLKGYGVFRSAFESGEPLTLEQTQVVWNYLVEPSIDYWVFELMKERHPDRTEQIFRHILKDRRFELERDFEPTLRKFKGEQMRRPARPTVTVIDDEAVRQLIHSKMGS